MNKGLILILSILVFASYGAHYNYTYHTNGADWNFGECFTGLEQSPINIDTRHAQHVPNRGFCFIPSDKV